MKTLHNVLEKAIGQLPEQLFGQLLIKKLKAYGIKLSPRDRRQLENSIRKGESKTLRLRRWRWWERESIILNFDEEETREIEQRLNEVIERLPQLIEEVSNQLSTDILVTLRKKCAESYDASVVRPQAFKSDYWLVGDYL